MICNSLMWSAMFVVFLVLGSNDRAMARSADGLVRIEKLLSSSSASPSLLLPSESSSSSSSPLTGLTRGHSLPKRAVLDHSCKGMYDRELFKKLDRVCDDCYNLYRKSYVAIDCRSNCYGNLVFRQCLDDLLLEEVLDDYVNAVQMVGK